MKDDDAPEEWRGLRFWWDRGQLIDELDELASPTLAQLWLNPSQDRLTGVDEVFHFLFDDHDFDERAIGVWLLDGEEVGAVATVKDRLQAILDDPANPHSSDYVLDNRYYLEHPTWPRVAEAAATARDLLISKGGYEAWRHYRDTPKVRR